MTPPLLCLHGFMGSGNDWNPFIRGLQAVSPKIHVAAPTLPGHGACPATPSMDWIIDQTRSLPGRPVIVGYSMGGRLAIHAAMHYGEFFSGLITISASPGISDPAARAVRRKADAALARRLRSMSPDAFREFLQEWWRLPVFSSPRRAPKPPESFLTSRMQNSPAALARCLTRWGQGSLPSLPGSLHGLPALFIAGEADATYCGFAQEMAAACPDGRPAIVPGAGHALLIEAIDDLVHITSNFLADLR